MGVALFEQDLVEYLRITLRLESYFIEDGRKTFFLESLPYEAIRSGIILRAWESTPALICGTRSVSLCILRSDAVLWISSETLDTTAKIPRSTPL